MSCWRGDHFFRTERRGLNSHSSRPSGIGYAAGMIPLIAFLLLVPTLAWGQTLTGRVRVIDGETLQSGQQRIQLSGIDAPESDQYCLADSARWPCGQQATKALKNYIGLRPVNCWGVDRDTYGRLLAVCFLAGENLNGWLVSQGWALAYRHFSAAYVEEEATAKADGRGMWRGQFIEPWNWRRKRERSSKRERGSKKR